MDDFNRWILKTIGFVREDIWKIHIEECTRTKALMVKLLRVAVLSVRGFAEDNCLLRASSLTFYSLLSIVPVAALAFGIAKGFGFQKRLERQILEQIPGQEQVLLQIVESANRFLENTKGGLVAGIGVVVLFWSVIKLLSHIENAFNNIWNVPGSRTFGRKFADYLSIMLIGPVLVITSSSLTVFITTQITALTKKAEFLGPFSDLIFAALKLLPHGLLWLLFTIMYMLMPNTRVRFGPGVLAGIIAGTSYQIAQWAYISFQIGVAKYNAVYGSFAALPLFLIWLQLSWLIVLFGAEISFAAQNSARWAPDWETRRLSLYGKHLLALSIARLVVKRFSDGKTSPTAHEISAELDLPPRITGDLLGALVDSGVLSKTHPNPSGPGRFQPAVDTRWITVHYVIEALEKSGKEDPALRRAPEVDILAETLRSLWEARNRSAANRLLIDL